MDSVFPQPLIVLKILLDKDTGPQLSVPLTVASQAVRSAEFPNPSHSTTRSAGQVIVGSWQSSTTISKQH